MFRLVSLNLNGIRSAAAKGFEAWAEGVGADCMGVQEVKAQAAQRWVSAVNADGQFGEWRYEIVHEMSAVSGVITESASQAPSVMPAERPEKPA